LPSSTLSRPKALTRNTEKKRRRGEREEGSLAEREKRGKEGEKREGGTPLLFPSFFLPILLLFA